MEYFGLIAYGFFTVTFNFFARYITTNKKEHKYVKNKTWLAFLIIPTKEKILLKPFINYMVHLGLFIILGLFYATGWIFIGDIDLIMWAFLASSTFVSLYCTGVLTRFYY